MPLEQRTSFFLRYFCPAIFSPPQSFGLVGELRDTHRRTFVLVSKALQNVVNGVDFKEPYMRNMNDFTHSNISTVRNFLLALGKVDDKCRNAPAPVIKSYTTKESLRTILNCMAEIKDSLIEKLHQYDNESFVQTLSFKTSERLVAVCMEVGMPKKGKKIGMTADDPKVLDLLQMLKEEDQLLNEIGELASQEKDKEKFGQAFVHVLIGSKQSVVTLIKNSLQRELPLCSDVTLLEGMGGRIFQEFCKQICSEYLSGLFTPIITELAEAKEDLKPNSDRLMETTQKVLAATLKSLSTCPDSIWEVCNFLFKECSNMKASPRPPVERVGNFLFLGMFCPALENPDNFNLTFQEQLKKKSKKSLQMISEVLHFIVRGEDVKDQRMQLFVKKRAELTSQLLTDWLSHPGTDPKIVSAVHIDWNTQEDALRLIHGYLCDKMSVITYKLGSTGNNQEVKFKLSDLITAFVSPSRKDNTKSTIY